MHSRVHFFLGSIDPWRFFSIYYNRGKPLADPHEAGIGLLKMWKSSGHSPIQDECLDQTPAMFWQAPQLGNAAEEPIQSDRTFFASNCTIICKKLIIYKKNNFNNHSSFMIPTQREEFDLHSTALQPSSSLQTCLKHRSHTGKQSPTDL